jgi:hypothetical protein
VVDQRERNVCVRGVKFRDVEWSQQPKRLLTVRRTTDRACARRWGTREAIDFIRANILEGTAVEVDDGLLGRQVPGLSEIGFNPHAAIGFPNQVTS